jgi:hypothetical protein
VRVSDQYAQAREDDEVSIQFAWENINDYSYTILLDPNLL